MSLEVWLNNLRRFRDGGPGFFERAGRVIAHSAIAAVNNRIVETGTDANGKKLVHAKSGKEYSEAELPVSTFVDSGMLTRDQARRLPLVSTYVDAKKLLGRYRGKRDMMLTGRMWGNTGLTEVRGTNDGFKATVEGRSAETQMKLDRNSELSGVDVLTLSKAEEEDLAADFDNELQMYVDDTFKP